MAAPIKPLSLQSSHAKQSGSYQTDVRRIARGSASLIPGYARGSPLFDAELLYARIVYLHTYPREEGDADNIVKPLLDALCSVVYADDRRIKRIMVDRIYFRGYHELEISLGSLPERASADLLMLLTGAYTDVLFIEVGPLPAQPLDLGRVP